MKISVVIPIYNVEKYLRQALSSVVNQTYRDLDIVCVDDGSTDNSLSIIKEFAAQDNRIQVITQKNQGTYITRQVGANAAQGDYILFLDPDDWLELDACEKLSDFAKTSQADIIQYGAYVECEEDVNGIAEELYKWLNPQIDCLTGPDAILEACYIERKVTWNVAVKLIKASVAKKAFSYQSKFRIITLEDYLSSFYVYAFSQTYRSIPLKFYHYRLGIGVSTKKEVTIEDFARSVRNFQGFEDLERFITECPKLLSEKSIGIARNTMRDYVINDAFNFIFTRLPRTSDAKQWYDILKQYGIDDEIVVKRLYSELNNAKDEIAGFRKHTNNLEQIMNSQQAHIASLDELIANQQACTDEQHRCIEQQQVHIGNLQNQINGLSEKNKKHLKQIRVLLILIGMMIIGLIGGIII